MKTLRVTLADIIGPTGTPESVATVHARYVDTNGRGRDVHLTDGTIVVPVRRVATPDGDPETFDFEVYANDAAPVREVDYGHLVEVSWTVVAPTGAKTSGVRRVAITDSMDAVVQLGLLATPTPVGNPTVSANFAASVIAAVENRVRHDAAQGLTAPQQAQARDNIRAGALPRTAGQTVRGTPTLGEYIPEHALTASSWAVTNGAATQDGDAVLITRTNTDGGSYTTAILDMPFDLRGRTLIMDIEGDANVANIYHEAYYGNRTTNAWDNLIGSTYMSSFRPGRGIVVVDPTSLTGGSLITTAAQLADFRRLGVRLYGPSPGTSTTLKIHSVRVVDTLPAPGALIIYFDDGHSSVYEHAFPIMQANGLIGTVPMETGKVGLANRLTLAQMREMQAAGWHFCSHGVNGEENEPEANLAASQQWLANNGFTEAHRHFAYGGGAIANMQTVKRLFLSARAVTNGPQCAWPVTDRFRFHGGVSSGPAAYIGSLSRPITAGAIAGGLRCATFHDFTTGTPTGTQTTVSLFTQWCAAVAASGMPTLGVGDAWGPDSSAMFALLGSP